MRYEEAKARAEKRIKDAKKSYSAVASAAKGAEMPAAVALTATAIHFAGKALDSEITPELSLGASIALYGLFRGIRNWWKNRDR